LLWDPDPHSVENMKYSNAKMQKLADAQNKKQQQKLNELVGRKKDLLKKKQQSHSRTVAEKIRSGVHEEGGGNMEYNKPDTHEDEPETNRSTYKMSKLEAIKDKMRKKLAQKKTNKQNTDSISDMKEKLNKEKDVQLDNITQRTDELNSKKNAVQKIDQNIEKIMKYMENKKV